MTIRVTCSGCGSTLKIKDELAGKDGSCPKCKAAIHIPKAKSTADAGHAAPQPSSESSEADDEDDMFGKDFFKVQETPSRPKYTTPNYDDDEADEKPKPKPGKKNSPENSEPKKDAAPAPVASADTAANMAGQLLAKTGKKNRAADLDDSKEANEQTDYSELKYLLTRKVLPLAAGGIFGVTLLYWMMSSMMAEKVTRPELGYVRGICTIDGKPAAMADIRFFPKPKSPTEGAKGSFSTAISAADGSYVLHYDLETEGAVVGKHQVTVIHNRRMWEQEQEVVSGTNDKPLNFQ